MFKLFSVAMFEFFAAYATDEVGKIENFSVNRIARKKILAGKSPLRHYVTPPPFHRGGGGFRQFCRGNV